MSMLSRGVVTFVPTDQQKQPKAKQIAYEITVPTPYLRARYYELAWDLVETERAALGIDRADYPQPMDFIDAVDRAAAEHLPANKRSAARALLNRYRTVENGEQQELSDKDGKAYDALEADMRKVSGELEMLFERQRLFGYAQRQMAAKLFLRGWRNLDLTRDGPRRDGETPLGLPDSVLEKIDRAHLAEIAGEITGMLSVSEQDAKN